MQSLGGGAQEVLVFLPRSWAEIAESEFLMAISRAICLDMRAVDDPTVMSRAIRISD